MASQTTRPRMNSAQGAKRLALLFAGMAVAAAFATTVTRLDWQQLLTLTGIAAEPAAAADIEPITRTEQRELLALTSGPQAAILVEGHDALLANAALAFSSAPIIAARPFSIAGAGVSDKERALQCMTQAVYYEAGFEPIEGRRAVAQVVLNRMRHPAFPKSVCGVVYQGSDARVCQFSFTCDGSLLRTPAAAAWAEARKVAVEALNGTVQSAVGLATHYHADYVSPYWAPRLTKLAQLGAHIFYRWPGGWGAPAAFGGRYAGFETIPALRTPLPAEAAPVDPADALGLPPERRAENDVGGRLDTSKGWVLTIPSPTESKGNFATITSQQGTATAPPAVLEPFPAGRNRLAGQERLSNHRLEHFPTEKPVPTFSGSAPATNDKNIGG